MRYQSPLIPSRRLSSLLSALLVSHASSVFATERGPERQGTERKERREPPLPPGDSPRPVPDYGGKPASTTVGDVAWWVPRVALFPAYVVSEFVVRRPVGLAVTWAERHHVRQRWHDFFTLDDEGKLGLFPTGMIDLGLRPRVGFYFFWLDAVGASDIKLHATTAGLDAWSANALWVEPLTAGSELRLVLDYWQRPDRVFYGLERAVGDHAARYRERRMHGKLVHAWRRGALALDTTAGCFSVTYDPSHEELGDQSLSQAIASGRLSAPPALEDGVLAVHTSLSARLDTRPARPGPLPRTVAELEIRSATGAALAGHVGQMVGLVRTRAKPGDPARLPHWLRYGASALGALDITGTERTVTLEALVELAEPLANDNPIPFTEQVPLGGSYPLRAFGEGHLLGESAAVATFGYGWPVWPLLDGYAHYSLGNVFGRHLRGFSPGELRSSFGLGLQSVGSPDHPFELLVALGTKPFNEGGELETLRLVVGTRAGF